MQLASKPPLPFAMMTIFVAFDVLQLLIVPLSPASAMPWAQQSLMGSIYKFLLYVNLMPRWSAGGPQLNAYSAQSLSVAAIVVCAVFSAAFAFLWLSESLAAADSPRSAWRARFFWYLAPPLLTALYAPMVASLMAPLACAVGGNKLWMNTTLECWSGAHVGLLIAGLLTLLPFIAIACLFALTLVDRRVSVGGKDNATCAVHGRVDAGMQVLRLGLAAFFVFGYDSNAWLTVIVSIAAGLAWLGAYVWWLPYYRLRTNQGCAIGASVFLCAGVAAALSVATSAGDGNGGSILFLFLILPVAYCCYSLVAFRWRSLQQVNDLSSPYLVELKARFLLVDSVEPVMKEQASARGGRGAQSVYSASKANSRAVVGGPLSSRSGATAHKEDDAQSARSGTSDRLNVGLGAKRAQHTVIPQRSSANDLEACPAGPGGIATIGDALRAADGIYADAARTFNGSALLDIFAAQYLGAVRNNRHLERLHLKMAASKAGSWALDVQFFAFYRQEQIIESDADASGNRMTVQRRIELEDLLELSRLQVDGTRAQVLAFWETLSQRHPELSKLQATGVEINRALQQTDSTFRRLLALAPQSATVMRAYAEFLIELANDGRKGMELLNDAEQIEDEQSRAHASSTAQDDDIILGSLSDIDLSADSLAMIRVSAEIESIGAVTMLNAGAQKLLGYTARELVGRDVNTIIPEPIASEHGNFLARYLDTGLERIIGTSRTMFMQHRSGYVMPIRMSAAKSMSGDEWFAVAEEIRTNWSFLWFMGEEASWRLTAVCKASQALLGIDPVAVRGGGVALTSLVPDVEDMMAQFEVNADKSVLVRMALSEAADAAAVGTPGRGAENGEGASDGVALTTSSRSGGSGGTGRGSGPRVKALATKHRHSPTNVLVAARLQTFHIPALEAPFHILRFRRATPADQTMGALGSLPAYEGRSSEVHGPAMGAKHSHAHSSHVSWGRAPSLNDVRRGVEGDEGVDDARARALARPPTPPGSQHSARKHGITVALVSPSTRVPAGHPSAAGDDISLCPVMGGGRASVASTGQASGSVPSKRRTSNTPYPAQAAGFFAHAHDSSDEGPRRAYSSGDPSTDGSGEMYHQVRSLPQQTDSALQLVGAGTAQPLPFAAAASSGDAVPYVVLPGPYAQPSLHELQGGAGVAPLQMAGIVGGVTLPFPASGSHFSAGTLSESRHLLSAPTSSPTAGATPSHVQMDLASALMGAGATAFQLDLPHSVPPTGSPAELLGRFPRASVEGRTLISLTSSDVSTGPAAGASAEPRLVAPVHHNSTAGSTSKPPTGTHQKKQLQFSSSVDAPNAGLGLGAIPEGPGGSSDTLTTCPTDAARDGGSVIGIDSEAGGMNTPPPSPYAGGRLRTTSTAVNEVSEARGPASVHSGSKGSGGSGASVSDVLRRGVAAKGKRLERSLVLLNRAIIVAFLLVGLMNIASLALTSVLFNQLAANFQRVGDTASRGLALQRIFGDVQSLQLHNSGQSPFADNGTAKVASLVFNLNAFEEVHLSLYATLDAQVQEEVDLYVLPRVDVTDLTAGQFQDYDRFNATFRNISLMNAGAEVVARGRRVAASPVSSIVESNTDAFWVVYNGFNPIRNAANASSYLADSRSQSQSDTIAVANYAVLGVGIGILLLIGAAVITPAVFQVLGAKQAIMDVFLDVPVTVIKALKARTQKRVAAAQAEAEGDDVALDVEDDRGGGEQDDGLAAVAMAANGGSVIRTRSNSQTSIGTDEGGDAGSRAPGSRRASAVVAPAAATTASTPAATKSRRRYSRASSAKNRLLVAMLWPIVLYVLYFVGTFLWKANMIVFSRYARSEVYLAHQLEFWTRQVNFNLRTALSYNAPAFVTDQVKRAHRALAATETLANALLYGSTELNTRATLKVSPAVAGYWTQYACIPGAEFYYTMAECEAFNDGILARSGLLGAFQQYLTTAAALLAPLDADPGFTASLTTGPAYLSQQYATHYFPPVLDRYSDTLLNSSLDTLTAFNALNLMATLLSLVGLFGLYIAVYLPLVRRLDREIKQVRNLLLLFPDEVSRNCNAIILAGREMVQDGGSVAGSGSVMSGGYSGRGAGRSGLARPVARRK